MLTMGEMNLSDAFPGLASFGEVGEAALACIWSSQFHDTRQPELQSLASGCVVYPKALPSAISTKTRLRLRAFQQTVGSRHGEDLLS